MRERSELYFSLDIEADGPCPGLNSMLSMACVVVDAEGTEHGDFTTNLELLPGAAQDADTMAWWKKFPGAWAKHREDLETPEVAMRRFCGFVERFRDKNYATVALGAPLGFDFTYVYYYCIAFAKYSPLGFNGIDMASYAMGKLNKPYRRSTKRNWPAEWRDVPTKHTHIALDDAREQAQMFVNMLGRA